MQSGKQMVLLLAGLCVNLGAAAAGPTATAMFQIEDPVTHAISSVLEARLDQYVCLSLQAKLVSDGDHSVQLTIYDGLGKEVHKSMTRMNVSGSALGRRMCYAFQEDYDAAGTWWYVVELDGNPLISTSIEIRPLRR